MGKVKFPKLLNNNSLLQNGLTGDAATGAHAAADADAIPQPPSHHLLQLLEGAGLPLAKGGRARQVEVLVRAGTGGRVRLL